MNQQFLGDLILKDIDGNTWRLAQPFGYVTAAGDVINVPCGFITDLASIPWAFRWILPKSGPYNKAAVIHDWLYANHLFPREKCDNILLEAMLYEGVNTVTAHVMWAAVRLGGWIPWRNEKRRASNIWRHGK